MAATAVSPPSYIPRLSWTRLCDRPPQKKSHRDVNTADRGKETAAGSNTEPSHPDLSSPSSAQVPSASGADRALTSSPKEAHGPSKASGGAGPSTSSTHGFSQAPIGSGPCGPSSLPDLGRTTGQAIDDSRQKAKAQNIRNPTDDHSSKGAVVGSFVEPLTPKGINLNDRLDDLFLECQNVRISMEIGRSQAAPTPSTRAAQAWEAWGNWTVPISLRASLPQMRARVRARAAAEVAEIIQKQHTKSEKHHQPIGRPGSAPPRVPHHLHVVNPMQKKRSSGLSQSVSQRLERGTKAQNSDSQRHFKKQEPQEQDSQKSGKKRALIVKIPPSDRRPISATGRSSHSESHDQPRPRVPSKCHKKVVAVGKKSNMRDDALLVDVMELIRNYRAAPAESEGSHRKRKKKDDALRTKPKSTSRRPRRSASDSKVPIGPTPDASGSRDSRDPTSDMKIFSVGLTPDVGAGVGLVLDVPEDETNPLDDEILRVERLIQASRRSLDVPPTVPSFAESEVGRALQRLRQELRSTKGGMDKAFGNSI